MMIHPVIEVDIKSPSSRGVKTSIQQRLERRHRPVSAKTAQEMVCSIEKANRRHQDFLQSRIERSRCQFQQAKTMAANKDKAVKELANQLSQSIQERLVRAETNKTLISNAALNKTKAYNIRVALAQKKREEIEGRDEEFARSLTDSLQLRIATAELRRGALLEEYKEKAATDNAKVKSASEALKTARADLEKQAVTELSARQNAALSRREKAIDELKKKAAQECMKAREAQLKKEQAKEAMETKLQERIENAEMRRKALMEEQREKAASAVMHAKEVAAEHAKNSLKQREELLQQIQTRLAQATERRASSSPKKQ